MFVKNAAKFCEVIEENFEMVSDGKYVVIHGVVVLEN